MYRVPGFVHATWFVTFEVDELMPNHVPATMVPVSVLGNEVDVPSPSARCRTSSPSQNYRFGAQAASHCCWPTREWYEKSSSVAVGQAEHCTGANTCACALSETNSAAQAIASVRRSVNDASKRTFIASMAPR
jgi:hypothetical protein